MQTLLNGFRAALSATGAVFFPEEKTLLLSDLHVGKASHFRKNGVPISAKVGQNNLWNLSGDLELYKPDHVFFLGDLFHSKINDECFAFRDFLDNYPQVSWSLVEGNHDILQKAFYESCKIEVIEGALNWKSFLFSHEPIMESEDYNIAGHIHPGVRLIGKGKQSLRLACFYEHENGLILPAYGDFTGKHVLKPKKGERIFALSEGQVTQLN